MKKKERLKLSVAICTFNGAEYISEELVSILNQKMKIDEIVVCDDGSTDGTWEIVKGMARLYEKKTKWKICKNDVCLGVIKNFEKAIGLCSGELIFLADQDDVWFVDKTEIIVEYMKKHQFIDVVFSDAVLIDEGGGRLTEYTLFDAIGMSYVKRMWKAGMAIEIFNGTSNKVTGCTVAMRNTFKEVIFPLRTDLLHDYQIAIRSASRKSINYIDQPLMKYRLHCNNVVGLRNSWVFSGGKFKERDFLTILEPVPARDVLFKYVEKSREGELSQRLDFLNKRCNSIKTLKGRIKLLFDVFTYVFLYREFSFYILIHDLLYGKLKYGRFLLPR